MLVGSEFSEGAWQGSSGASPRGSEGGMPEARGEGRAPAGARPGGAPRGPGERPRPVDPVARQTAIEELVRGIRGIVGCRAVLAPTGEVVELHVVSAGDRPPKLIIRDIQSLLLVRLNLAVPHRRISVAVVQEADAAGRGRQMREQASEYVVAQRVAEAPAARVAATAREAAAAREQAEPGGWAPRERAGEEAAPLVLQEVAVRYEGARLEVRVELLSFGRRLSGTASGPDEGLMPALLGARAVMEAVAADPAWADVHLQWVDLAGVNAAPAAVVSVVRGREAEGRGGRTAVESLGVRPERGNLTLAAAAATVDALAKLSPPQIAAI